MRHSPTSTAVAPTHAARPETCSPRRDSSKPVGMPYRTLRFTARLLTCLVMVAVTSASSAFGQEIVGPPPAAAQHQHPPDAGGMALFPARDASGTAWLPDETPMYAVQRTWRGWQVMLHANAFAQFLYEPGYIHRTGGFSSRQFSSVNWGMVTARRPLGAGRVGLRAMGSAEPWTVSACGFLNLLATGDV
jgi:hypothetical protein